MASYNEEIKTQLSLYDEQNEKTLEAIPLPPTTEQLSLTKGGVVNGPAYARTLTAEYSATDPLKNILLFYSERLLEIGWQEVWASDDTLLFTLGTACMEVFDLMSNKGATSLPTDIPTEGMYRITIWHDFFSQPCSIPTPEGTNLCAEIFAGACLPCPPK